MTYPGLDSVNASSDLSELLIYVNTLTGGTAIPAVLGSFFLILAIGGSFLQLRTTGRIRYDFAFAAASFATFGMAVIMSLKTGLLAPQYLFITLGLVILSAVWLYLSTDSN